jgi:hypothetical protein
VSRERVKNRTDALTEEVLNLTKQLDDQDIIKRCAIPWAAPVPCFGSLSSRIATLGLNPSNLEYVDREDRPLSAKEIRLETLSSLGLESWREADEDHARRILSSCENYFLRNPYNQWFRPLDRLLAPARASYYTQIGATACHLDLVPYATWEKWSSLRAQERSELLKIGARSLARVMQLSNVQILVLNGRSVIQEVERSLAQDPSWISSSTSMPEWSLQDGRVQGAAYIAKTRRISNVDLGRTVLLLGYNHNIQSSFGVTSEVIRKISEWIKESGDNWNDQS